MILQTIVSADAWFEHLMLAIRTPLMVRVFAVVTFFGEPTTIIALAGVMGLALLYWPRGRSFVIGFVTTLAGAAATGLALKDIVKRARPSGLIPAIRETGFSFPSGHATGSMAFYGFTAFLLCKLYPRYAKAVIATTTVLVLAIGFSRLYLGVHFPSDVIGGYLLGGLWLFIGVTIVERR
ncbi:MAG TPA: phosphatase PAP2 family protein [Candidatus Paceibacterota bacterium]|nr:phosphatase PAP2 family protein [Candidatus Paceibacterota bacterium]